jgi:hypothetical protein
MVLFVWKLPASPLLVIRRATSVPVYCFVVIANRNIYACRGILSMAIDAASGIAEDVQISRVLGAYVLSPLLICH